MIKLSVLRLLLIFCLALGVALASGNSAKSQVVPGLNVVLLIDNSTSLGNGSPDGGGGGNDPKNLRWSAAQLFVDLASPGDQIAAFTFSTEVRPLGDAANGQLTPVTDADSKQKIKALLGTRPTEGYTDMSSGLRKALDLLQKNKGVNRPVIVFLTDGMPDPASQIPSLNANIEEAGRSGVMIFPILLGSNIDRNIANKMVADTGGLLQEVPAPDLLPRAFGKVYTYIKPEMYADELPVANSRLAFRTNLTQSITRVSIIVPRENAKTTSISAASLDRQSIKGVASLPDGAQVVFAEGPHYQLITVTHNSPLKGDWLVETPPGITGNGLLLATSSVTLDLMYPLPRVAGSFVSPRLVPLNKPSLLVGQVMQNGSELGDLPLALNTGSGQTVTMDVNGVSTNHSLEWRVVDLGLNVNADKRIEIQLGTEVLPFRLRKEFVFRGADNVPKLVIDSPTTSTSGLVAGGKLKIAAHFDRPADSAHLIAYISEAQSGDVKEINVSCNGVICQDESFTPQSGRSYQVILVGTGLKDNIPFSDGARTMVVTKDTIRLDGLEKWSKGMTIVPGSNPPPLDLQITAFLQQGQPELSAQIADLAPMQAGFDPKSLLATLSPLAVQQNNLFTSQLNFSGFDRLPIGSYTANLLITTPKSQDVSIEPGKLPIQFKIVQPVVTLSNLPNPLDFGEIQDLTLPQKKQVGISFSSTQPFDLEVQTVKLSSSYGDEPLKTIQLDADRPIAADQQGNYTMDLRLSALQQLRPGAYRAQVKLRAANQNNPARIDAEDVLIVFTIPEPSLVLKRIGSPTQPTNCPVVDGAVDPNIIDFGAILGADEPAQVDLYLQGQWISGSPQLKAELASLVNAQNPSTQSAPIQFTVGTLQKSAEGLYIAPLVINLTKGQPGGAFNGQVNLSAQYLKLLPASLRLHFEVRNDFGGRLVNFLQPAVCTTRDWYSVTSIVNPFPRWKGIFTWLGTLLIGFLIVGTIINRHGVQGIVRKKEESSGVIFNYTHPVYVVCRDEQFILSQKSSDGDAAVAIISFSQPKAEPDTEAGELEIRLNYGPGLDGFKIYRKIGDDWVDVFNVSEKFAKMLQGDTFGVCKLIGNVKPIQYVVEYLGI